MLVALCAFFIFASAAYFLCFVYRENTTPFPIRSRELLLAKENCGEWRKSELDKEFLFSADPLADKVVEKLGKHPHASKDILILIETEAIAEKEENRQETPCTDFLNTVNSIPSWVNKESLSNAQIFFMKNRLSLLSAGFGALMESYLWGDGAIVLMMTGRLSIDSKKIVKKRLMETGVFTQDVGDFGVLPGSQGFKSCLRVRLLHSWVRKFCYKKGWGSSDAHRGCPANQLDMAHTINLFSWVALRNTELQGYRATEEEAENYHHLWRYAGWLLGTDIRLLPEKLSDEILLYNALVRDYRIPNEASKVLISGLLTAMSKQPPFYHSEETLIGVSRYLLGDDAADELAEQFPVECFPAGLKQIRQSQSLKYWDCLLMNIAPGWTMISCYLQKIAITLVSRSLSKAEARKFSFSTATRE